MQREQNLKTWSFVKTFLAQSCLQILVRMSFVLFWIKSYLLAKLHTVPLCSVSFIHWVTLSFHCTVTSKCQRGRLTGFTGNRSNPKWWGVARCTPESLSHSTLSVWYRTAGRFPYLSPSLILICQWRLRWRRREGREGRRGGGGGGGGLKGNCTPAAPLWCHSTVNTR